MISFLFDNYGYYPSSFNDNTFEYKDWIFKLVRVDNNSNLDLIEQYNEKIKLCFNGFSGHIIKNRNNQYISYSNSIPYALISVPKVNVNVSDYLKLHSCFTNIQNNKEYSLNKVLKVEEQKYEFIENVVLSSIRRDLDSYTSYLHMFFYYFGLAENSLQYLSDAIHDFGDKLDRLTLTHKKNTSFSSFDFFDPFNYIIDNPIRDIAQLFKNENLTKIEMEKFLDMYNLSTHEASVLFSYIMYPQQLFDELIEFYDNKKDISSFLFKEKNKISLNKQKIKTIYYILQYKYNIRPIKWIENEASY
ncbi:MAG: hypothetical protein E7184_02650 [Erysipelotrichaceae bacterium]|nr:hypothetical protein [Erysipelotrichaceae bacterium]